MKITFTEKDFKSFRNFEDSIKKKLGDTTYVGTDSVAIVAEFSSELKAVLRPFPTSLPLECDLIILSCNDCKKNVLFLKSIHETTFVCDSCMAKRRKK